MIYQKTVEFFAAHFNETAYLKWIEIKEILDLDATHKRLAALLQELLLDIHGHNFKATVRVEGETNNSYSGYLISDEDIDATVGEWRGINLSVHPDFEGVRATTENMAAALCKKIAKSVQASCLVTITLYESENILAISSLKVTRNERIR